MKQEPKKTKKPKAKSEVKIRDLKAKKDTKGGDGSSPNLFKGCCTGQHLP